MGGGAADHNFFGYWIHMLNIVSPTDQLTHNK